MRNLVIARITELWKTYHILELDLTLNELPNLSNAELIEVLEDMIAITQEYEGE
jgi:hypothetical protein